MEVWAASRTAGVLPLLIHTEGFVPRGNFKRAGGFAGLRSLISGKGGDTDQILQRFGIEPHLLDDNDAYLPYGAMARVLEFCAEAFDAPHFGFELGCRQSADVMGPLAVLLLAASTMAEGLELVARHMKVHAPGARLSITTEGQMTRLSYEVLDPDGAINRHIGELSMATAFNTLRTMAGEEFRLDKVDISGTAPLRDDPAVARFFGVPVDYEEPVCAVWFSSRFLSKRLDSSNPTLLHFARAQCETICPDEDRLPDLVASQIRQLMPMGSCTLEAVARQLSIHPRSLQNRLTACGQEFRDILKAQRQELAQIYLARTSTPIAEVASLLGYSDQTTFTRAFSTWFDVSPKRFRAAHRIGAAAPN